MNTEATNRIGETTCKNQIVKEQGISKDIKIIQEIEEMVNDNSLESVQLIPSIDNVFEQVLLPSLNKNCTLPEYNQERESGKYYISKAKITHIASLTAGQYDNLAENLMKNIPWLSGLGGWYSRKWGTTPAGFAFKELAAAQEFAGIEASEAQNPTVKESLQVEIDHTTPEGNAQIMANDALKLEYQDPLDAMFQIRLVDTRNALINLGWKAGEYRRLEKTQGGTWYTSTIDFDHVGAGKNLVGIDYYLDRGETSDNILDDDWQKCFADDLTRTPEELAVLINAATLPAPGGDGDGGNLFPVTLEILPPETHRPDKMTFETEKTDRRGQVTKNQAPPALIAKLKENNENWEYYPTTTEIINKIKQHRFGEHDTVLDCGAGNGSTLAALTSGKKYAIEKSQILVNEMSPEIFVVGCDFWENSLIDKKVDTVFCNPPYSQYKEWAIKVINEANAGQIFLVIPERWKDQPAIMAAIEDRKAHHSVIGSADFLEADRKARAKVDIVKINLSKAGSWRNRTEPDVDPFALWVSKEFPIDSRKKSEPEEGKGFSKRLDELVPGRGLVQALVGMYQAEMLRLQANFRAISNLDQSIFEELKVDFKSITEFLKNRIKGLKEKYWRELFGNLEPITSRLTVGSRAKLLETLTANISVDFTESNIYAVTSWAIKNANTYFDSQLIEAFEGLVDKANLINYKSNQKTWGADKWRFREDMREGRVTHYGLDYRCVLTLHGTFSPHSYDSWDYPNGLGKRIHHKLNDLVTIANNLGFPCKEDSLQKEWEPGKANNFLMNDKKPLMAVRAYKNGNLHIKFNQIFLRKLNVEFGRLKGWLRGYKQAAQELNIPEAEAKQYFKANFILECSSVKLLEEAA